MHVGTLDNKLPSSQIWWSQGKIGPANHLTGRPEPRDFADVWPRTRRSIIMSTLRDIREPMKQVLLAPVATKDPTAASDYVKYLHEMATRCAAKYGADSPQARELVRGLQEKTYVGLDTHNLSEEDRAKERLWAPTFEQIMSLPRSDR